MTVEKNADVLLLDISMPGIDGFEAARRLKAVDWPGRVIILSMHKDPVSARIALEAGVSGYVLKEEAFSELAAAVRKVAAGGVFFSPSLLAAMEVPFAGARSEPLSPREREIVLLVVGGKSTREIAADLGISVKTADTHRQRAMDKLGLHKVTDLVLYAMRSGLIK